MDTKSSANISFNSSQRPFDSDSHFCFSLAISISSKETAEFLTVVLLCAVTNAAQNKIKPNKKINFFIIFDRSSKLSRIHRASKIVRRQPFLYARRFRWRAFPMFGCFGIYYRFIPINLSGNHCGKPMRPSKSWKRESSRKESNCGSTFSQIRKNERSWNAFSSHAKVCSLSPKPSINDGE